MPKQRSITGYTAECAYHRELQAVLEEPEIMVKSFGIETSPSVLRVHFFHQVTLIDCDATPSCETVPENT